MNLFLLGAGFNIDIDCGYPVIADVLNLCFGFDKCPEGKSVEDLFSDALGNDNYEPLKRLADQLMDADCDLAQKLASSSRTPNCYREFFGRFRDSQFLTFNYDSLPEIFLTQLRRWYPEDGYGVRVATERQPGAKLPADARSASLVLHLHGSLCVYTADFDIRGDPSQGGAELAYRERPLYAFDADSIAPFFPGYRRMMLNTGYAGIEERVIAPVPDKSQDIKKQKFVRATYAKALSLTREAETLVIIGYSFNINDRVSYSPVLEAFARSSERTLTIVSPQASELRDRIGEEYPRLKVRPIQQTFRMWAADSFSLYKLPRASD